ncbi:MAG: glycoside hydrolase family 3 protein [Acidobacteria bacterium]|nr:glycoside hydrolase family 3 protein [Acidobacteriota bacterium]
MPANRTRSSPRRLPTAAFALLLAALLLGGVGGQQDGGLDADARRWVDDTLQRLTLDEKIGQLLAPSFRAAYTSSDSETYDELAALVRDHRVGGLLMFGARTPQPRVLLNPNYSRSTLGRPLDGASLINRLQAAAQVPLLVAADFETGAGFRLEGATAFPPAMAFGAAGDPRLAFEAGRITAAEARAMGVHVNFAPVVDVNNNPRNPVINIRSFGEDPARVGELASAYVEGLRAGGMLATIKHFPGHGDTDVDSHIGLPIINHPRERLDRIELVPFRAGIAAGADAVMTAHIELPALDPAPAAPATFSRPIVEGLLRDELGFDGLVFTDSMRMRAVSEMVSPGEAAARAVGAGHDIVLHSPDDVAAIAGIQAAAAAGDLSEERIDRSVRRILSAKARLGLHRQRAVSLDALPDVVGTRAHAAVAQEVGERSLTLIRDERSTVPLPAPRDGSLLYLSVLDYPAGWGIGSPSRAFIPELEARWPDVTAIELSDQTPLAEIELVRETARRYDAVVAGVFVRTAAFSGRMDLAPALTELLVALGRDTAATGQPFVTVMFGNPYSAAFLADLPAILLTYGFYDLAEATAVRAVAGEIPIRGRLPVSLGDAFPLGHGLDRSTAAP